MNLDTNQQIKDAAIAFKKAIESTGQKDVVLIYSYRGKKEGADRDVVMTNFFAENFLQAVGTCDLVKHDILCPHEND